MLNNDILVHMRRLITRTTGHPGALPTLCGRAVNHTAGQAHARGGSQNPLWFTLDIHSTTHVPPHILLPVVAVAEAGWRPRL